MRGGALLGIENEISIHMVATVVLCAVKKAVFQFVFPGTKT